MRVHRGKFYLFEERVPLRTHQVLRKELSRGRRALYISKNAPELLRSQLDFDRTKLQTRWLSPRIGEEYIPPMNLKLFEDAIHMFMLENEEGIVVLNGLDVLEKWNGWMPVMDVLRRVESALGKNRTNLIVSLDPKSHYSLKLEKLEFISDEIVSSCA